MTSDSVKLRPLSECAMQSYFCAGLQLADVIEWAVKQCGASRLMVSTFSAGDEFLRRLYRLKQSGAVTHCTLVCDTRAMKKTRLLMSFMSGVVDEIRVVPNHSKVVLVEGDRMTAAIVTSQNLTRGNRTEAGMVISDQSAISAIRGDLDILLSNSTLIYGTF